MPFYRRKAKDRSFSEPVEAALENRTALSGHFYLTHDDLSDAVQFMKLIAIDIRISVLI